MYGASSRKVIFKWNFSGTPCGGACEFPGQAMSLMSSFCDSHDFHVPIFNLDLSYYFHLGSQEYITSSHAKFLLLAPGRRFMIFNSADFKSPSAVNSILGRLVLASSGGMDTFLR